MNFDELDNDAAKKAGIDPAILRAFAKIESGNRPWVQTGSYKGRFQLSDSEFRKYGGQGNIFDAAENTYVAARKLAAEANSFKAKYGRDPSAGDLYLIHQQGAAGAAAHWANPSQPAWMSMYSTAEGQRKGPNWARRAIWGNVPADVRHRYGSVDNITSAQFVALWNEKVSRFGGSTSSTLPYTTLNIDPITGKLNADTPPADNATEHTPKIDIYGGEQTPPAPQVPTAYPVAEKNDLFDTPDGIQLTKSSDYPVPVSRDISTDEVPSPVAPAVSTTGDITVSAPTEEQMRSIQAAQPADPYSSLVPVVEPDPNYIPDIVLPREAPIEAEILSRPVGTAEANKNVEEEIASNKSWWDRADAAAEVNMTGDMIQQLGREITSLWETPDPEWKIPKDELMNYPEQYHEMLFGAVNKHQYEALKADVDQRLAAQKILDGYTSWHAANIAVDLTAGIAFAMATDGVFSEAAIASGVNLANRLARVVTFGASGATYGAIDYKLNKDAGNDPSILATIGLGILGGMAFGALSKASVGTKKALAETAEDAVRADLKPTKVAQKAADEGKPIESMAIHDTTAPRDVAAEVDVVGTPLRPALDAETAISVRRTATGGKLQSAIENFDEDMAVIAANVDKLSPFSRISKKISDQVAAVFERQAHRLEQTETYYARLPDRADITKMLEGRVVKLERRMEDAVSESQAIKNGGKEVIVQITVPKGSRVLRSDDLKWSTVKGQVILGEGSVKVKSNQPVVKPYKKNGITFTTKAGKGIDVEIHHASYEPPKSSGRSVGKTVVLKAQRADGENPLLPEELMAHNNERLDSATAHSLSASGVREDTSTAEYALRNISTKLETVLKASLEQGDTYGRILPKGATRVDYDKAWWNPKAWAFSWFKLPTEANQMAGSENKLEQAIGRRLVYSGVDPKFGDKAAHIAVDERFQILHEREDAALMKEMSKLYKEFIEESVKAEGGSKITAMRERFLSLESQQAFSEAIHFARRTQDPTVPTSIKKAAAYLDKFYNEHLDMAADPATAFNLPSGSVKPVSRMDIVRKSIKESGKRYMPRVYLYSKIQQAMAKYGNDAFYDWAVNSFKKNLATSKLTEANIEALTRKFHDTILNAKGGFVHSLDALTGNMHIEAFIDLLQQGDVKLSDEVLGELRAWARPPQDVEKAAGARTMMRAPLDEDYKHFDATKYGSKVFTIDDFIDTDAIRVARNYSRSMAGRIAAAHFKLTDTEGKVLIDGITSDADVKALKDLVSQYGVANKLDASANRDAGKRLDAYFDYLFGNPQGVQGISQDAIDRIRFLTAFTTFSKMGRAGFNQVVELGNAVADGGINAVLHMPQVQKLFGLVDRAVAEGRADDIKSVIEWAEHETGIGTHLPRSNTMGRGGSYIFGNDFVEDKVAMRWMTKASRATLVGSGMIPLTAEAQKGLYSALLTRVSKAAAKAGGDYHKLPPRYQRMFTAMDLEGTRAENAVAMLANPEIFQVAPGSFGRKIAFVNTGHANFDPALASHMAAGLRRIVTRSIQENKYGTSHRVFNNPIGQALMQFKGYTVQSITQQHVQRLRQITGALGQMGKAGVEGNGAMFGDALASLAAPAGAYIYQMALGLLTYRCILALDTLGMSESEKRKVYKERWDKPGALLNAMIARAGPTGWMPTAWNSGVAQALGGGDWYLGDYRSSGLSNTFVPPVAQTILQDFTAVGKMKKAAFDKNYDFSDKDAKNLGRMITNFWMFDLMTSLGSQMLFPDAKK